MLERRDKLFKSIVEEYLKTAEPVGSLKLSLGLKASPATIRNEMMELEELGFIYQPHTSAGRIPSAKGYEFYIQKFVKEKDDLVLEKKLQQLICKFEAEDKIKHLARVSAEITGEAIIVVFSDYQFYYTGLSNLFGKPEFSVQAMVTTISQVLDHCEEVMPKIKAKIFENKKILLGLDNPFDKNCSFVGVSLPGFENGIFGILGPMRMDYQKNVTLVNSIKKILV